VRLAICVPTAGTCKSTFAYALAHSVGWFAKWEQTEDITLLMQESSVVHSNREALVDRALAWGATHILFADDDMYWPPKAVLSLISRDLPFVACNYPKRTYPIEMTAVDVEGQRLALTKESTGVEEIQFAGFGLTLIRADVFKELEKPWFLPGWMDQNADYTTEDAPLYIRARSIGKIPHVDHDASKMDIGHIGLHVFAWNHSAEIVTDAGS
jgi:hypothetical protein